MSQEVIAAQTRVGAFDTVAQADRAIRRLLTAGFAKEQLAVICPAKFKEHFLPETPKAEVPAAVTGESIAVGGALGATLGGLALVATAITGGAGVIAAGALVGGGMVAGVFSNLFVAKGYEKEADDHYKQAVERGQIVVAVEVEGEKAGDRLAEAQRILDESEGEPFWPV